MKWSDDDYDNDKSSGGGTQLTSMILGIVVFIVALFGMIIYVNRYDLGVSKHSSTVAVMETETETVSESLDDYISGETRTASDLDIWNMYPEETESSEENDSLPTEIEEEVENDPATDGKHTLVTNRDGSEEWVAINNYLTKSSIDVTGLVMIDNMMEYYKDGEQTSYAGVDISKYDGDVDFAALKKAGIQYVMIRVGARGYESGNILLDEYFSDNIEKASAANLDIGLYFYSQAINTEEAQIEAQTVLDNIGEYSVTYPIAIDMEYIDDDSSRIESMTTEQRTTVTKAFCDTIQSAGYTAMIYGNKEWLIKEINLSALTDYDIWLAQNAETPDYPYQYAMWQYSTNGDINGISENANLDISFIDYSIK